MKNNKQNKTPKGVRPFSGTLTKLSKEGGAVSPKAIAEIAKDKLKSSVKTMKPKNSFIKNLAQTGGNLLKSAAPEVVGLIPGVGPLAKMMLSTMNDDEWFSEFGTAGATFNELNALQSSTDDDNFLRGIGATMHFPTFINSASGIFRDQMPSILAYVRNKAQNILMDDVNQYTVAFVAAVKLYAIYYTGKKYVMLSENQPLNIPLLYSDCFALTPSIYSAFAGMIENLGQYLKTSVRLPYALVEYLRWRFGTSFYSSNTGKPGLVFYDYVPAYDVETIWSQRTLGNIGVADFIANLGELIEGARTSYISAGRAGADLKLAYDDHQIRYDVEKPHYDEKEFCLRSNLTPWYERDEPEAPLVTTKQPGTASSVDLYLDSRLDTSPALQAVTISTGISAFIAVQQPIVAWYLPVTTQVSYMDDATEKNLQIIHGWHSARVHYNSRTAAYLPSLTNNTFNCTQPSSVVVYGYTNTELANLETEMKYRMYIIYLISNLVLDSMQQHAAGQFVSIGSTTKPIRLAIAQLAFDRAVIPTSQLESIQRIALRN